MTKRQIVLHSILLSLVTVLIILFGLKCEEYQTVQKLQKMDDTFHAISPHLSAYCREWAKKNNWPTWLCGPTSFAIARYTNHHFFSDTLPITTQHMKQDHIQLIVGAVYVPTGDGKYRVGDHVWIEVYWNDLIIFIDPTYSQLDNLDQIAFAWFYDNPKGWKELAQYKRLLRLTDDQNAILKDISCPEEYKRDSSKIRFIIDSHQAPKDWLEWSWSINRMLSLLEEPSESNTTS